MIMKRHIIMKRLMPLLLFALFLGSALTVSAQQFRVESFKTLPNDVSAFITPVRDLNGDACALVKVSATDDFAFSSPLGIVKRKDDVGEVWLYLPQGSRLLTIKHPEWGVMRDYRFPKPLESHVTYELTLEMPQPKQILKRDTIVMTKVVTDTMTVGKPQIPLSVFTVLTATFGRRGPSWGLMAVIMRSHGFYVHGSTSLSNIGKTSYSCDNDGYIESTGMTPYYSGHTRRSNWSVTAGGVHRLWRGICVFEGIGYGREATAWQLAQSEGGGYVLNDDITYKGIAAEVGALVSFGRLSLTASLSTISGKYWQGGVGVGIRIGKNE